MHAPRHVHTLRSLANYWLAGWLAHLAHLQFLFAFTSNSGLPLLISKASRASRARFCEEGASHGCRLPSCFGCIPSWLRPLLFWLPPVLAASRPVLAASRPGCLPSWLPPVLFWLPPVVSAASRPGCIPSGFGCFSSRRASWLPSILAASRPGCVPSCFDCLPS